MLRRTHPKTGEDGALSGPTAGGAFGLREARVEICASAWPSPSRLPHRPPVV